MYSDMNFKTKKQFKEAVAVGKKIRIYQPGGMFHPKEAEENYSGTACVEGPHYPQAHSWCATVEMKDGYVVKVK